METKKKQQDGDLLDRVIVNFTEDQKALQEQSKLIEDARSYKNEIKDRLKDSKRDLVTLMKYASDQQLKKIDALNIEFTEYSKGLNPVAESALKILEKHPKGAMTNEALYDEYVKGLPSPTSAYTYTEYNIKLRSLFNSQKLIRDETKDAISSREHIIRINGFKPKK